MIAPKKRTQPIDGDSMFNPTGNEIFDKPMSHAITIRWICAMRNIISLRKDGVNSRKAFALKMKMQGSNVSAVENMDRNITLEACALMCDIYGIAPDWLLLGRGDMYGNSFAIDKVNWLMAQVEELKERIEVIEKHKK